jgi:glycyl-tRNA synthetase beta chain
MTEHTKPLLIELGTEELPVKALPGLAQAFFDGVIDALQKRGIEFDRTDAKPLYTPRRLAVLLPAVSVEQPEQSSEVLGPYLNIALDAEDQPTKALQGFAAKAGIDWTQLERTTDAKGERFVHRSNKAGASTASLLPEIIRESIAAMPIPKPMRWGDRDYAFARPVHWLVLLLGGDVIDAEVLGVRSDRMSRGHRFEHDKPVWIGQPGDYVDALRAAHVLVDADERRARIAHQVQTAAAQAGGVARITTDNLEQVNCLVEWPSAVLCSFESEFLEVPQEALIATMEANQKFFPVLGDGGRIIRKGYERVIRPRFSDAKFFFDEDLKQGLVSMGDGLKTVTYQAKLGTVADKVERVAALAETIAKEVGVDAALARGAAELSKNDLQSRMVNEFPELQGIAGRHYAKAAGETDEVSLAIDESYQPRFAGDDIALSPVGKVLAIAERLDTLAGGFAAGLKPTGNKDPFALRRNALGLARTIIESGYNIDIKSAIHRASESVMNTMSDVKLRDKAKAAEDARQKGVDAPAGQATTHSLADTGTTEIYPFILDRMRSYYVEKGVPVSHFNAVAELEPKSLYDFDTRLDAIGQFATLPEAEALAAANKRINNILKKADVEIPHAIDRARLNDPVESALAEAVEAALGDTDDALHHHDYIRVLGRLALLRPQVDAFFDSVMVNVDDVAVRKNRLALLKRLADRFRAVAAIEHLSS